MDRNETHDYSSLFVSLRHVLIEIRGGDNLHEAQAFADIFHNVPGMMQEDRSVEEIRQMIFQKAEKYGWVDYMHRFLENAERR